jgi:2,3-bisphosphoglycerate-dependent phosphoglycerate mutase
VNGGGFDALSGAGVDHGSSPAPPRGAVPPGIRTVSARPEGATRLVLIRHGEAECNVSGVCGGRLGCTGLTRRGRAQVEQLRDRLLRTGELAGADALYASILPRAVETAELVAPALARGTDGYSEPVALVTECGLCELHPGEADGLTWDVYTARFGALDWDVDPGRPIAPGGESWTGFVNRVAATLEELAARHPGELVVVACHAGVIEASLLAMTPVAGGRTGARLRLRTQHASMTSWEVTDRHWTLLGYNDAAHLLELRPGPVPVGLHHVQQA